MNTRKWISAFAAAFIVYEALNYLIHTVILIKSYAATISLWRPDMNHKMWILWLSDLARMVLFVYIFSKGYEKKGWVEGLRYGLWMGLFAGILMGFGAYVTIPIPFTLAMLWFVFGTLQLMCCGVSVALVARPAKKK
jgi:hypothetical protein